MFRKYRIFWEFVLLFGLALLVKLLYIKFYHVSYMISPDGLHYSNMAENFLKGKGLVNTSNFVQGADGIIRTVPLTREYVVGPIYPLILAFIYFVFGLKSYAVVAVVNAALNALTAVLAYKVGQKLFGRAYGWIPYILIVSYPLFSYWGIYVLTEACYTFVLMLFLYVMVLYQEHVATPRSIRYALLLGGILGVTVLVRPFLLMFFPILLIWMLWLSKWEWKTGLKDFFMVGLVFVLIMSPWWVRNYLRYHEFIAATNYGAFELYAGNNPYTKTNDFFSSTLQTYDSAVKDRIDKLPVLEQEKEYSALAKSYILEHPLAFVKRTLAKEKNLFWQPIPRWYGQTNRVPAYQLDKYFLILGLLGALLSLVRFKKYSFLLFTTVYYSLVVSAITVVSGGRYRLPIMPAVILLGSLFLVTFLKGLWFLLKKLNSSLRDRPIT